MLKRIHKLSPRNLLGSGQENGKRGLFPLKWTRKNLSGSLWLGKKYVAFFSWNGYARISLSTLLGWARNKPWLTNFYWVRYVRKVDFIGKGHTTPQVTGPSTYVECSAFPPWGLQECQEGRSKLKSNIQFPPSRAQKLKRYYHLERCLDMFTTMWIRNTDELS